MDLQCIGATSLNQSSTRRKAPRRGKPHSGWFARTFIEKLKPRWVVLENVTPMSGWPRFDDLMARL
jgi:site-specific DNA-cytosine methylase